VRRASLGDKPLMIAHAAIGSGFRHLLDFALPARCAGCGIIVDEIHSFCGDCWKQIEFLAGGCTCCGLPLKGTDIETCVACLAKPPRIERTRAAVAYDDKSRSIALRLKYSRRVALARTMARYMAPLVDRDAAKPVLVPVPLHRLRLWNRTPPLKGLSQLQRRKTIAGAFAVHKGACLNGATVILVDDVLTTGSTANACARVLQRAGADRVHLVTWARVVRPNPFTR
jgi:predicted amidophosphoribosyltransferase